MTGRRLKRKFGNGLNEESRAFVAESLLQSLDFEEDFSLSEEWKQQIRRRCEAIDSGQAAVIEGDKVLAQLRKKYPS